MKEIILASQSPRRKQLLEWAEINFEIIVEPTDESFPDELSPAEAAVHIAREKARVIKEKFPGKMIIAADTIVVLHNEIIGKPTDREDAILILQKLSGSHHKVITGLVITQHTKEVSFADITDVEFYDLTKAQIEFYVDKYKPYDKAGAYGAQDWIGMIAIEKIIGSYFNVMGLPIHKVYQQLSRW